MGRSLAALVFSLIVAAPAAAQDERSVLLILDSSKSMDQPAGEGSGTRLDVAKAATKELLQAVPEDAPVGLRVYGSKLSGATRQRACRDTGLVIPVGPVDRGEVTQVVDGLEGRGRTPIGRSLLAAADDLPAGGRRTVILVSDGGDNCAPPDPCRAAREVSRQGIDLTIQVVGLQVDEGVREQLQCIADAGGGTYVDATDASLNAELAAVFARAFRRYEPAGEPIEGGPAADAAVSVSSGQYLDSLEPGRARWYSIDLEKGQRLFGAATLISKPPPAPQVSWLVEVELQDPQGEALFEDTASYRTLNGRNPIGTFAASLSQPAPADGTYRFGVSVRPEEEAGQGAVPVEVTFSLSGGEAPPPRPQADPASPVAPRERASDVPELAGVGAGGLMLGALAGFVAMRSRRRT